MRRFTLRNILVFSVITEIGTAVGLIVDPAIVFALLVRGALSETSLVAGRTLGITLLALGLACWPKSEDLSTNSSALHGMLTYNGLVALYLAYVGSVLRLAGPMLWPVVGLHALVALLLIWRRMDGNRDA